MPLRTMKLLIYLLTIGKFASHKCDYLHSRKFQESFANQIAD